MIVYMFVISKKNSTITRCGERKLTKQPENQNKQTDNIAM